MLENRQWVVAIVDEKSPPQPDKQQSPPYRSILAKKS
jgi:hypothetical protein